MDIYFILAVVVVGTILVRMNCGSIVQPERKLSFRHYTELNLERTRRERRMHEEHFPYQFEKREAYLNQEIGALMLYMDAHPNYDCRPELEELLKKGREV